MFIIVFWLCRGWDFNYRQTRDLYLILSFHEPPAAIIAFPMVLLYCESGEMGEMVFSCSRGISTPLLLTQAYSHQTI